MKVLKFGGSVLKNAEDVQNIGYILDKNIQNEQDRVVVVFSAFFGITNKLLEIVNLAVSNKEYKLKFNEVKSFHYEIINKLSVKEKQKEINDMFLKLEHLLVIVYDCKQANEEIKDSILSFGERLSSLIISSFFSKYQNVKYFQMQNLIKTDNHFGYARVDVLRTEKMIKEEFAKTHEQIIVCAGFIGSDEENRITTLGRNGSDYSAAIIASALNAECLEIWKDTDGLYTADPKIVKDVKFIKKISYQEMAELSSLGNKVLHINAIFPCITKAIPIFLKNCYNIDGIGTKISNEKCNNYLINGIVKLDNIVIIKIEMNEFVDMTKVAIKTQEIIQDFESSIITISQNFKQKIYSIITTYDVVESIYEKFQNEFSIFLKKDDIMITVSDKKSMISVIGADFSTSIGIAGRIFNLIQQHNVNIDFIHDDFSQTRISFLCNIKDANNVVNFLHTDLVNNKI